ncbi:hypothetical protein [Naasia sp. SYSU D00948]|uniref:hypothetical protein n=1 Tax=Naasia sp. SYSU D00948 TaxID=2817379 RepID=UPI001B30AC78|nr:hypothetical protein [Naasia sp. SYSU D00948]
MDALFHLVMTALLAGALCVASVVVAGGLALTIWAVPRIARRLAGIVAWVQQIRAARANRTGPEREPRSLTLPALRHRLRRP